MSRTRLDCHGVSEKRADVHVCSSAGTLGKNSAAKAESSNATRMAPVDAKYARALMRVWQQKWGRKPELQEILGLNAYFCRHAEWFAHRDVSSSDEEDEDEQLQHAKHGSSELFCFSCKRTQSELDRRKKKGTKGTAFAGGVVLRHLDRVGWFCVAHAKKARSAQAEAAAAGSPPRQSSVSGSSSPSSHSPVVKPMRRPKRPLLPGDTGRIDGYAKRLADDVSMEVGRSANPDAVAAAIGSSLAARMPQLLPGAENGRVALAIIEESIAPVLGGMACAAPRGGNVPTDVRGASEAAAMLVGAVKSVPGHVVANLLGGMVNDSAAGQAAMARVAATSKPGAAEWSSVAAVSRQLSRGRQKRKASPSALSSFAPKPRVRATTFKNLHLAIAVVAAVFIKLSSCTGVRCAWPLNLTAILLLLPLLLHDAALAAAAALAICV